MLTEKVIISCFNHFAPPQDYSSSVGLHSQETDLPKTGEF